MQAHSFSLEETSQLRTHGIVLFAGRVIFDAQPPMASDQIAAVQALCGGKIPPALVALWQLTAGGRLAYDLTLPMNGNEEAINWIELFYNGSDGYRDLTGWIEHERELADDAATERGQVWSGELGVLPFGGFEYCNRIYVVTDPKADDYGYVLAWKQGLPSAWRGAMHEDGLATVAPDLHAAFQSLQLDTDPLNPASQYCVSEELLDYLDEHRKDKGMSDTLAKKLIAFYRHAMVDWQTPLANGTLAQQSALARSALRHAIDRDDAALVAQLSAAGVSFSEVLAGSAIPTEYALALGAYAATTALIKAGAPVRTDAFASVSGPVSPELVNQLLDAGVLPSAAVMAQCVAYGVQESARHIGAALSRQGVDVAAAYTQAAAALLQDREADAKKVRKGKLSHYLGVDGLEAHAQRLRDTRVQDLGLVKLVSPSAAEVLAGKIFRRAVRKYEK